MVCDKCEKKLSKVIVPDKWKEGASNTTEGGGRKINENKLLSKKKSLCGCITSAKFCDMSFIHLRVGGLLTELPSASFASSKYTRMANTVTHVPTPKSDVCDVMQEFVRCAGSKYLTPSFTNKVMYKAEVQYFSISSAVLPGILPAIKAHLPENC
ncbi:hypothetical protein DVH24_017022 [Malus domestica]|uniref:Cysteine-rich PDZ-binding protein n=1 Tax=Malus domestica TaxID=3750 RepID=A0A498IRX6_MALDO|nr:hypothetical protein DVH24_017022 [Malus domestica]